MGLIQAPEGAPGIDADATTTEGGAVADLGAPGIASFAETQPQTRSLMPGPVGHPPVVVELFHLAGLFLVPARRRHAGRSRQPRGYPGAVMACRLLGLPWLGRWFCRRIHPPPAGYAHASGERAIYRPRSSSAAAIR